jgi:hypothetical protein
MGHASGPITFNRRVLHDVPTDRVRRFTPLAGDLIWQYAIMWDCPLSFLTIKQDHFLTPCNRNDERD